MGKFIGFMLFLFISANVTLFFGWKATFAIWTILLISATIFKDGRG